MEHDSQTPDQPSVHGAAGLSELQQTIAVLTERVAYSEAALRALASNQVDAVLDSATGGATLLKGAQEALLESQARYRRLVTRMSALVFELAPDGEILFVNEAIQTATGLRPADLEGLNWENVFSPSPGHDLRALLDLVRHADVTSLEFDLRTATGLALTLELSTANRYAADGTLERIVGFGVDVSARKRAEEARRHLAAIVESSAEAIVGLTPDGAVTSWNDAASRLYGQSEREALGRPVTFLVPPDHASELPGLFERVSSGKRVEHHETVVVRSCGRRINVSVSISPINDASGQFVGISMMASDITPRKRAEQLLGLQYNVARIVSESSSVSGAIAELIQIICEQMSWEFGVLWELGRAATQLHCAGTWSSPAANLDQHTAATRQLKLSKGDGLAGWVWQHGSLTWNASPAGRAAAPGSAGVAQGAMTGAIAFPVLLFDKIVGVMEFAGRAIHEPDAELIKLLSAIGCQIGQLLDRRRSQEVVEESDLRFRQITEAMDVVLWQFDGARKRTLYVSQAYEKLWGEPLASLYADSRSWMHAIHPDDRAQIEAEHDQFCQFGSGTHTSDFRIVRKDGSTLWVALRNYLTRDESGRITQLAGVVSDITDRIELQQRLLQAQKMEAVGHIAGGVAHDFNNLLSVILGYAQLAIEEVPEDTDLRQSLEIIMKAGNRGVGLTRQLLAFSRKQVLSPRVLDINAVISSVQKMLCLLIGEDITLTTQLDPRLWRIRADPAMLEQVILNLVINGRDAMPRGGRLLIESGNVHLDAVQSARHGGDRVGPHVMLAVTDTGTGMTREVQAKIFEPFFTTKAVGKGTGLGLATVFGIVKQSEGQIGLHSEPGKGTCFKLYFPQVLADLDVPRASQELAPTHQGVETVLVVEDEESLRSLVVRLLAAKGYEVLEAANGAEALAIAAKHAGPIELMLCDVIMPALAGPDAAASLMRLRPEMHVLFMSGYTEKAVMMDHKLDPATNFIEKPFSPGALLDRVRLILDQSL